MEKVERTECPRCGSGPDRWIKKGIRNNNQTYRCTKCRCNFRQFYTVERTKIQRIVELMHQGISDRDELTRLTGCCKWTYYASLKEFQRQIKNQENGLMAATKQTTGQKNIEKLRAKLPELSERYLTPSELCAEINAKLSWFKSSDTAEKLYYEAINKPRMVRLRSFLDAQHTLLTNDQIAVDANVGVAWLAQYTPAIELLREYRDRIQGKHDDPLQELQRKYQNDTDYYKNLLHRNDLTIKELQREIVSLVAEAERNGSNGVVNADLNGCKATIAIQNQDLAKLKIENEQLRLANASKAAEIEQLKRSYADAVRPLPSEDVEKLKAELEQLRAENNHLRAGADPRTIINMGIEKLSKDVQQAKALIEAAKLLRDSDLFASNGNGQN